MEDVSEAIPTEMEETVAPAEDIVEDAVEDMDTPAPTMQRPAALLKPIRGTLRPLEEEETVTTAPLTPVGHMLVPEKKRGPPPTVNTKGSTTTLRPVRGTLTPVSKTPVKRLEPDAQEDED